MPSSRVGLGSERGAPHQARREELVRRSSRARLRSGVARASTRAVRIRVLLRTANRLAPGACRSPHIDVRSGSSSGLFTLGSLREGEWPVIGVAPEWRREEWPLPLLCRYDEL